MAPKGCKLTSQVDRYLFSAFGPGQGNTVRDLKNCFKRKIVTTNVKFLGLISVIAPIRILDLSSTLALTLIENLVYIINSASHNLE
jgi:hypothetical protein